MKTRIITSLLSLLLLAGCSSKPSEIIYYQLNDSASIVPNHNKSEAEHLVQLSSISVPDYLKQSKLVLRTAPHKLHFSSANLWVQPPQKDIKSALLHDLNGSHSDHQFVLFEPGLETSDITKLFITITHLYPTENAEVILQGHFTILGANKTRQTHFYSLKHPLNDDGYEHAVEKQRKLVGLLASDIIAALSVK